MANAGTLLVGTVGQGVFRSAGGGATRARLSVAQGMHSDCVTRCLTVHPEVPATVYAGTDHGIYRSDDGRASWRLLSSPGQGRTAWAHVIDDASLDLMISGTGTPGPARLYRSADGGVTWCETNADIADSCPAVGVPRPTALAIDPTDHASVRAGIEVDGIRHSVDGGLTWKRAAPDIRNPDVHNVLVTSGPSKRIFVLVNNAVWISDEGGESWRAVGVRQVFPWHYPRGIAARPDDPSVVFVTVGDATPGRIGAVLRRKDAGRTWATLPLPVQPNSAMRTVFIPRSAPDVVLAASRYGHLYRSDDGGDHWVRLWREFSEVSSLARLPG